MGAMTDKQQLTNLLSSILSDIDDYIQFKYPEYIPTEDQRLMGYRCGLFDGFRIGCGYTEDKKNKQYILVGGSDGELTAKRILNLLNFKDKITEYNTKLEKLDDQHSYSDFIISIVNPLSNDIQTAIDNNAKLDLEYHKKFHTYHQNRIAGMGVFSSWLHKSFIQSNSMQLLEDAIKRVEEFKAIHPAKLQSQI